MLISCPFTYRESTIHSDIISGAIRFAVIVAEFEAIFMQRHDPGSGPVPCFLCFLFNVEWDFKVVFMTLPKVYLHSLGSRKHVDIVRLNP